MPKPETRLSRALLCAALLAPLAQPLSLSAEEPPPLADEESLRAAAEEWLDRRLLRSDRLEAIEFDGPIVVESEAEQQRLTLPPGRVTMTGEHGSLAFDGAGLLLAPRPDGLLDLSWRLPSEIAFEPGSEGGEVDSGLTLARQIGHGIFAPESGSFLGLETLLGGLALRLPDEGSLTIEELGLSGDSQPSETQGAGDPPLFDSRGSGQLRDLVFAGYGLSLDLEELLLDAALDGLELAAYGEAVGALEGDRADAPPLFSFADPLFEAGAVSLELSGLAFEAGFQSATLERGEAALALDGLRGARSALVLRAVLADLRITPLPPLTGGLLPRDLVLDLEVLGLPNAELDSLLRQISVVAATAGTRYAAGMGLPDFWRLLQRAEAELRLTGLQWHSTLLRLEGDAMLNPSNQAALGLFGQLRFEIEGLPQLLEQLRGEPQAQRLVQLLTLVQGLGIPLDTARPAGARRYEVVATSDGRLEVNGTDVMPLLPGSRR